MPDLHPHDALSPREQQILVLLAAGYTNHEIADQIGFSHGTMRNYMSSIFAKLGVTNRVRAAIHPRTVELQSMGDTIRDELNRTRSHRRSSHA